MTEDEAEAGFFPLFNGEDLDGWFIRGDNKAAFAAEDGELRTTGKGGGDWIFTDATYANFVLRLEYKLDEGGGNSGVAIRATRQGNPAFSGMEVQVLTPSEPHLGSSGSLYAAVAPQVKADKPAGEWNSLEVYVDGPRIRTTMNGQVLYDIDITKYDSPDKENTPLPERAREGHIAIQDYGDEVAFRKLRIKPLPGGTAWSRLFDGKTLDGWTEVGDANWTVEPKGVLRFNGDGMTERSGLRTQAEFDDFELRMWVRCYDRANSGVYLRGTGDEPWPRTYEVQINNHDSTQFTGSIWAQVAARELRARDHHWFLLHMRAAGANVQVDVNGKTVVDFISTRHDRARRGYIMLQGHDPKTVVEFRDIEVRPA